MEKEKVGPEMAEDEFLRFIDGMGIKADTSKMDDKDLKNFEGAKEIFLDAIQLGSLVINDNDEAVYTPWRKASGWKEAITFHERRGGTFQAMDSIREGKDIGKLHAMMGALCKKPPSIFTNLASVDYDTCAAVFMLLAG